MPEVEQRKASSPSWMASGFAQCGVVEQRAETDGFAARLALLVTWLVFMRSRAGEDGGRLNGDL